MELIRDNLHANELVTAYFYTSTLPDDHKAAIRDFVFAPSVYTSVVKTCEYLYANRDALDDAGRVLVAQLATFAAQNAWSFLGRDNRGGLINQAMAREMGVKLLPGQPKPQRAEQDPAPLPEFAPPALPEFLPVPPPAAVVAAQPEPPFVPE